MEAWRLMLELSGLLVLYAVLVAITGEDPTPYEFLLVILLGAIGIYAGRWATERLFPDREE